MHSYGKSLMELKLSVDGSCFGGKLFSTRDAYFYCSALQSCAQPSERGREFSLLKRNGPSYLRSREYSSHGTQWRNCETEELK